MHQLFLAEVPLVLSTEVHTVYTNLPAQVKSRSKLVGLPAILLWTLLHNDEDSSVLSLSRFCHCLLLFFRIWRKGLWACDFFPQARKTYFEPNGLQVHGIQLLFILMKAETSYFSRIHFHFPNSVMKNYNIPLTCKQNIKTSWRELLPPPF